MASIGNIIYVIGGQTLNSAAGVGTVDAYILPYSEIITSYPQWMDPLNFSSSHFFSVRTVRGKYLVQVTDALGVDNVVTAPNIDKSFIIDYAGEISDTSPPPAPFVSAWGNGSLTQLSARALVADPESDIVAYRYAIGTTPGGTDVINWTDTIDAEITHTGLSLLKDQAYYVSFIARNVGGLWSPVGISNPVVNGSSFKFIFLPVITR